MSSTISTGTTNYDLAYRIQTKSTSFSCGQLFAILPLINYCKVAWADYRFAVISYDNKLKMGCCASPGDSRNMSQPVVQTEKKIRPGSFPSTQEELADKQREPKQASLQTQVEIQDMVFQFFDKYDKNGDDYLDQGEVEIMLNDLYARTKNNKHLATKDQVKQFFKVSDKNGDMLISKDQLYHFYRHHR